MLFRKNARGFTLVELMMVVAIIGILAAIAIPAFSRYVKKARSAEAAGHLHKMWVGATSYYGSDHADVGTTIKSRQFPGPNAPSELAQQCGCHPSGRCPGGSSAFSHPIWVALGFGVSDPHNFMPGFTSDGTGTSSTFTAVAQSDLDCDGTIAEFRRIGRVDKENEVVGASGAYVSNEGE